VFFSSVVSSATPYTPHVWLGCQFVT
jgi:hypothetical protein